MQDFGKLPLPHVDEVFDVRIGSSLEESLGSVYIDCLGIVAGIAGSMNDDINVINRSLNPLSTFDSGELNKSTTRAQGTTDRWNQVVV